MLDGGMSTSPQPVPSDRPVRWAILATGGIAATMARSLAARPDIAELVAVGSRTQESADRFAEQFHVPRAHASYQALAEHTDADIVYIATPHSEHLANATMCLRAGRHVLVEKPMTTSHSDTATLVQLARSTGLFCMEAVWTRCNPLILEARDVIDSGTIGALRALRGSFAFRFDGPDEHRLLNPELAGGAILDLGVYPLHTMHFFAGAPDSMSADGSVTHTGVDGTSVAQLTWRARADRPAVFGSAFTSVEVDDRSPFSILGSNGRIDIQPPRWHAPSSLVVTTGHGQHSRSDTRSIDLPEGNFHYEIAEVTRCLRAGMTESELIPLQSSLDVAQCLDQWLAAVRQSHQDPVA